MPFAADPITNPLSPEPCSTTFPGLLPGGWTPNSATAERSVFRGAFLEIARNAGRAVRGVRGAPVIARQSATKELLPAYFGASTGAARRGL